MRQFVAPREYLPVLRSPPGTVEKPNTILEMKRHDLSIWSVQPQSHHVITPTAQLWFDRGLNWLFGFNHSEAIKCFQKALIHDGECAMAHWGISYASGPNYNLPWVRYDPLGRQMALSASYDAMQAALVHAGKASPVEQAMIKALAARYPQREAIEDMSPWDKAYTREMRKIFAAFPDDLEVRGVLAKSIMNETPWQMWDLPSGKPAEGAGTEECRALLKCALDRDSRCVGSPRTATSLCPPDGDVALPRSARCAPATGCARSSRIPVTSSTCRRISMCCAGTTEMCSSIIRRHWKPTAGSSPPMIRASTWSTSFTTSTLRSTARCSSASTPAIAAAEELDATIPEAVLRIQSPPMADFLEGYLTMKQHVLVRFGKWREIIARNCREIAISTARMLP